jgi:hypothetical protein
MQMDDRYGYREYDDENTNVYDELEKIFNRVKAKGEEVGKSISSIYEIESDPEIVKRERSRAITAFHKDLVKFVKFIETRHRKELWRKGERFPLTWMSDDPEICTSMKRTRMLQVLNYLDKMNLNPKKDETTELSKGLKYQTVGKSGNKVGKKVEYHYSFILVNDSFYKQAMASLAMSKPTIQKYMQQFRRLGILIRLIKTGKGGKAWLYADGYYTPMADGKLRKHPFLKNTTAIRNGLRNFRLKN